MEFVKRFIKRHSKRRVLYRSITLTSDCMFRELCNEAPDALSEETSSLYRELIAQIESFQRQVTPKRLLDKLIYRLEIVHQVKVVRFINDKVLQEMLSRREITFLRGQHVS